MALQEKTLEALYDLFGERVFDLSRISKEDRKVIPGFRTAHQFGASLRDRCREADKPRKVGKFLLQYHHYQAARRYTYQVTLVQVDQPSAEPVEMLAAVAPTTPTFEERLAQALIRLAAVQAQLVEAQDLVRGLLPGAFVQAPVVAVVPQPEPLEGAPRVSRGKPSPLTQLLREKDSKTVRKTLKEAFQQLRVQGVRRLGSNDSAALEIAGNTYSNSSVYQACHRMGRSAEYHAARRGVFQ